MRTNAELFWTVDYSGIKRSNDLLKYLDGQMQASPKPTRNLRDAGTCRCVFYYKHVVAHFGNILSILRTLGPYTAPAVES